MAGRLRAAVSSASHDAVASGYIAGWRLVRLLPEATAQRMFRRVADEVYRRDGKSVRRLRKNLSRVRPDLSAPELEQLTREGMRSYLRYWCESFRLPAWPVEDVVRRTRTVNEHLFRDPHASGRGVVAALPHMANWDWAGTWAGATGMPLVTVAERLEPERLFDEFVAYRNSLGMEILPLTGAAPTFPRLEEWASQGGLVCLLADRDLSRTSVEVTLCGAQARMPRGPALLARRTGAALLPTTLAYDGDCMELTFHPEIAHDDSDQTMMQGVADAFSTALRAHPQDWHMMQRVFVDDLEPGRS